MRVLMLQSWRSPPAEIDVTPGAAWKRAIRSAIGIIALVVIMPIAMLAAMMFAFAALGLALVAIIGTTMSSRQREANRLGRNHWQSPSR